MSKGKRSFLYVSAWFATSNLLAIIVVVVLLASSKPKTQIAYSVFSSKPPISVEISDQIIISDSRAEIINQFYESHNCPLSGYGEKIVEVSDRYGFDFWWIPAISFQESSCGKALIESSNNPFGYGIYGDNVKKFENFDKAIEALAWDLSTHYFEMGLIEPCDVMKKYTPPSKGSWCEGISFFRDELLSFSSQN